MITVTYLSPGLEYNFDITSVTSDGIVLQSISSGSIVIPNDVPIMDLTPDMLQAPVNAKIVTSFFLLAAKDARSNPGVGIYVNWKSNPSFPSCYFDVFVLKKENNEGAAVPESTHYQHIRARTKETHNVLRIDSLDFESNYSVRIFTADRLYRFQSQKSFDITIETPSCLEATNRNFSLCGPEPPVNGTGEFSCTTFNETSKTTNETTLHTLISLQVNWTMKDIDIVPNQRFQIDVANDPIPELIGAVDMPSDWSSYFVDSNSTDGQYSFTIEPVFHNQLYYVQIRTVFANKRSKPLILRLNSPGIRSDICPGFIGSDYYDDANVLIANWTNVHHRKNNINVFTELAISLSALCVIAIVIIGMALLWLRMKHNHTKHPIVGATVSMNKSSLYEMSDIANMKFDRFEVNWNQLSLLPHVLGEGAFGKVIHGQLQAPDLTGSDGAIDVAVKMLRDSATEEERVSLLTEIDTMKRVRQVCGEHPNVVSLLASVTRNGLATQPALVMELCQFGSLRDYLRQLRGKGPKEIASLCGKKSALFKIPHHNYPAMKMNGQDEDSNGKTTAPSAEKQLLLSLEQKQIAPNTAFMQLPRKSGSCSTTMSVMDVGPDQNPPLYMLLLSFAYQICAGMEHLAVHKFVHRDLATRNVLVFDFDQVKISDFGLSRDIYEDAKYQKTTSGKLPVKWMAPEAIIDQLYTTASDV